MGRRRYSGRHPSRYWGARRCVHRCKCGCGQRCRLSDTHYEPHAYHREDHDGEGGADELSAVVYLGGVAWAVVVKIGEERAAVHRNGRPVGEGTWEPRGLGVGLNVAGVPTMVLRMLAAGLQKQMSTVDGTLRDA